VDPREGTRNGHNIRQKERQTTARPTIKQRQTGSEIFLRDLHQSEKIPAMKIV
jgi:hypothetical protein